LSHTPRLPTQGQDGNSGTQERAQTMPHCHVNGSPYSLAPQHRYIASPVSSADS
jgi:hypothetical protein